MKNRFLLAFIFTSLFSGILTAQSKSTVILVSQDPAIFEKLDANEKLYARSAFQSFVGNLTLLDDVTVRTESNDASLRQVQKKSQIEASSGLGSEDSAYASDLASKADLRIVLSLVKYNTGYKLEYSASKIETMQIVSGASSESYFQLEEIDNEIDKLSYNAMKSLYGKGYISQIPYSVEVQLTHAEDTSENYTKYILELTEQIEGSRQELDNIRKENMTAQEKAEARRKEQAIQQKIQAAENAKRRTEEQLRKNREETQKAERQRAELKALSDQKRNDLAKKFEEKIRQSQEQQLKLNKEITQGLSLEKRIALIEEDRQVLDELEAQLIANANGSNLILEKQMQDEIDAINNEPWRLAETDANGRPTEKAKKYRESKVKKVRDKYEAMISQTNNELKGVYIDAINTYKKQIDEGVKDLEASSFVYRSYEPGSALEVTVGNYDGGKFNWTVTPAFHMEETTHISNIPDLSGLKCTVNYKEITGRSPVEYNGTNEDAYSEYLDLAELADLCFRTSTPYIYGTLVVKVKYNPTYGDYRLVFNQFTLRRMEDNQIVADYSLNDYNSVIRGTVSDSPKQTERQQKQQKKETERQQQHTQAQGILSSFINYWTPNMKQKCGFNMNGSLCVSPFTINSSQLVRENLDFRLYFGGNGGLYYALGFAFDDFDMYDYFSGHFGIGTSINFGCFRPYGDMYLGYGSIMDSYYEGYGNVRFGVRAGMDVVLGGYSFGIFINEENRTGGIYDDSRHFESVGLSLGFCF